MAMTFGKGNRSIAFNPTTAFPLDARSYFESYEAALAAAARAAMAGDTNTEYYFGQTVVVVENGSAALYIIQPNKTLAPFAIDDGSNIVVNANQFAFDEDGQLVLKGADTAAPGSLVSIDADGVLHWVAPIDAYTKAEVDSLIANAAHMKRKIVNSIKDIEDYIAEHNDADHYIYMVPTGFVEEADKYDEYMVIAINDEFIIEKVGSWEIDLTDYAKSADVTAALNNKVDKEENSRLIHADEIAKLLTIDEGAQVNFISSVSNDFAVQDGQLQLQNLNIDKVIGLQAALDGKVNVQNGWTLLSPTDQEKLAKLTIDGDQVAISGKVNAENVTGLEDWLTARASSVKGLSEENFTSTLQKKLQDSLLISSVDEEQLKVENGKLSIIPLDMSKISGLDEALQAKADQSAVTTQINNAVNGIVAELNNYVTKVKHQEDIDALWDALTWKEIN